MEQISSEVNLITKQPILIIFDNGQILIKLDSNFLNLEYNFLNALDTLFKCFWTFNLEYPPQAANFYYFFELVYGSSSNFKPSLLELHENILKT